MKGLYGSDKASVGNVHIQGGNELRMSNGLPISPLVLWFLPSNPPLILSASEFHIVNQSSFW